VGLLIKGMSLEIKNINVSRHDIYDYVLGSSDYDPVEKCIDPTLYETYSDFILKIDDQEYLYQDEDYIYFYKEMFKLKRKAVNMRTSEILRLCEEIEEIAPSIVKL
jgi:hypothetical protein